MAASFAACLIGTPVGWKLGGRFADVPAVFFDRSFTLQKGEGAAPEKV